jgi:Fibronectin type III domain
MRIRRRLAAGTAVVFAALAVLSSAPAASAETIDGHEVLPLQVIPVGPSPGAAGGLAVWNMATNPVAITKPGDCPVDSSARAYISLPGDELAGPVSRNGTFFAGQEQHRWLLLKAYDLGSSVTPTGDGMRGLSYAGAFGNIIAPDGVAAGTQYDKFLNGYDTTYSLSWSCWRREGAYDVPTPGAPLWKTSMKKISLAESKTLFPAVTAGTPGYYTLTQHQSPPSTPTNVKATRTPSALKASWGAVTAFPALTAYKVHVTAGGTPVTGSPFTAAATATSLEVPGLSVTTAYSVSVVASNALGDGPVSATSTDTPLLPAAPVGVTATPTPAALTASWVAVTANPAVSGYKVFVTAGGAPVTGSPFTVAAPATSVVVPDLRSDTAYAVSVVATNALGDGPASFTATATPLPVILRDGTITSHVMVAATTGGTISMTVTASGANLGTAVDQTDRTRIASGTLGEVRVSDLRVAAQQTPWKVQATTAPTFAPTIAGPAGFNSKALGSAPKVTGAGVTPGPVQTAGTASMLRLLANGTGGASGTADANLSLVVPVGYGVGTYTSVITIDLVKG